jgi:hypothetical protein
MTAPRYLIFAGTVSGGPAPLPVSCLARVVGIAAGNTVRVEFALVGYGGNGGPNLYSQSDGPSSPTFPGGTFDMLAASPPQPAPCPALGYTVHAVYKRTLYAVARLRIGDRPALYEFSYDLINDRFNEPTLLSIGVDDMAVHPLTLPPGATAVTDVTDGGANAADFPYTGPTAAGASQVVGLTVRLLSRGLQDVMDTTVGNDAGFPFANGLLPTDGLRRDEREARVPLYNLNPLVVLPD